MVWITSIAGTFNGILGLFSAIYKCSTTFKLTSGTFFVIRFSALGVKEYHIFTDRLRVVSPHLAFRLSDRDKCQEFPRFLDTKEVFKLLF